MNCSPAEFFHFRFKRKKKLPSFTETASQLCFMVDKRRKDTQITAVTYLEVRVKMISSHTLQGQGFASPVRYIHTIELSKPNTKTPKNVSYSVC